MADMSLFQRKKHWIAFWSVSLSMLAAGIPLACVFSVEGVWGYVGLALSCTSGPAVFFVGLWEICANNPEM